MKTPLCGILCSSCVVVAVLSQLPLKAADGNPKRAPSENLGKPWTQRAKDWEMTTQMALSGAFTVGEPINIEISYRNRSNRELEWLELQPLRDASIKVLDAKGQPVAHTPRGVRAAAPHGAVKYGRFVVSPGDKISTTIDLAEFFQLKSGGVYTVLICRYLTHETVFTPAEIRAEAEKLFSKPVTFTVE